MLLKKKVLILVFILLLLMFISLVVGPYDISIGEVLLILLGKGKEELSTRVVLNLRMPRMLFVSLAGMALSLAGLLFQVIFKNNLASPDILGVSSAASVGAIIGILFFNSNLIVIRVLAFICSLLVVFLAFILTKFMRGSKIYNLIISGIILGALANSLIMFLKYVADPEKELATIDYWLMGSFNNVKYLDLILLAGVVVPCIAIIIILEKKIKLLTLSDIEAKSLGINVNFVRSITIILATLLVSMVVSIVGVIAWLGLIVPHFARMLFKGRFKETIIYTLFIGGIILLVADLLAHNLSDAELPISIFTSALGALSLVVFLVRRKN